MVPITRSGTPSPSQSPTATAEARLGPWLRTGDLGYRADRQLFVCGRRKDLIIVSGRKYAPQDVEWAAGEVDGVRAGSVVAFALPADGGERERVVVVAEVRGRAAADQVRADIRRAVHRALALPVDQVMLVEPGALPKTSSGKLRRASTRALYLSGALGQGWPAGAAGGDR